MKRMEWILAVMLVGLLGIAGLNSISPSKQAAQAMRPDSSIVEETQEKSDPLVERALVGAQALHDALKDPASLEIEAALVWPDGQVCYQYRATNSFGAHQIGWAMMAPDWTLTDNRAGDSFAKAWRRLCHRPDPIDAGPAVRIVLTRM